MIIHSPSDIFGSLISDTEDFLGDLQSNREENIYNSARSSPAFSSHRNYRSESAQSSNAKKFDMLAMCPMQGHSKDKA